jgi:hypothetical protein
MLLLGTAQWLSPMLRCHDRLEGIREGSEEVKKESRGSGGREKRE